MKELMQKVIEAGLVPKHALQMMERWKMVEPGKAREAPSEEELASRTKDQLLEFAREISELLEDSTLPEMRETDLFLEHLFQQHAQQATVETEAHGQRLRIDGLVAVQTRDGRIALRRTGAEQYIEVAARPGNVITLGGKQYEIRSVEVRYRQDVPEFYSCEAREINAEV